MTFNKHYERSLFLLPNGMFSRDNLIVCLSVGDICVYTETTISIVSAIQNVLEKVE